MRVPVQFISFSCFLFSVTAVQGQAVTCELKSTTFGVKKINPAGKTIFRAGERVDITCTEKHWFFRTKETIRSFTCQDDGQWDHEPDCAEIRCEVPRDQHVLWPTYFYREDKILGAKQYYHCIPGYDKMAEEATCTRDGWTPNPLCAEKMCAAPNIPNAEIEGDQRTKYTIFSIIQYKCNAGFEPEQPVQIICNSQTEWTGIRQCTANQKLCPDLSVENGLRYIHSNEEEVIYSCNTGYKTFTGKWLDSVTCSKGSWPEDPRCIPVEECGAFPSVHHGKLKQMKKTFRDGETTAFECDPGFIPTQDFIKCVSGTWETPVCEVGVSCGFPPMVENAFITSKPEEFYVDGSSVTYVCQKSFLMIGERTVFCRNGIWEKTPTCREVTCVINLPANMRSDRSDPGPEVSVRPGETLTLSCVGEGSKLQGQSTITCGPNGEWNVPFPRCIREKCGRPPSVNFADTTEMTKPEYNSGQRVEYICVSKYTLDQRPPYSKYLTCDQGEWRGNIKCLKPCTVTLEEMDKRGIQLRYGENQKMFAPHEEYISFDCQRGKRLKVKINLRQKCNDGVMTLPECE